MKKLRGSAILMTIAILGITGFQLYWLKNNYDREKQTLEIKTNTAFRQTISRLQSSKLKLDKMNIQFDSLHVKDVSVASSVKIDKVKKRPPKPADPAISVLNLLQEKMGDSLFKNSKSKIFISMKSDTVNKAFIDSLRVKAGRMGDMSINAKLDSLLPDPAMIEKIVVNNLGKEKPDNIFITVNGTKQKLKDSAVLQKKVDRISRADISVMPTARSGLSPSSENNAVIRFLYNVDSLSQKDSVTVKEVNDAYTERLKNDKINISFTVNRLDSVDTPAPNIVTIGFTQPVNFNLSLHQTMGYMFDKLKLPILFSLLLVGITITSFVLLYRNMIRQQRLAALKNEFISNITHELKTPIATVGVAIEALKNFNAIQDPQRTREYLDISQNELQRLNLLVDKVLKLSMFEKKEVELKYEIVNLQDVVEEVINSMKLQIEKYHAVVTLNTEGDCSLQADRLHLLSVIFNLLDNALKYGRQNPAIQFEMEEKENNIELKVKDNGIGIPAAYKDKVFEKFFRIPHGNTHNAKGYGLGLSYVAHVIQQHKGNITVESQEGSGTTFTIILPKQMA